MKIKKGFIATSLVYSFFLAFIAVVAVLLNNYIANKTILDRFNGSVQDDLNTNSYTVTIYSRNANIRNGMTLTNLISNGNFSQNLEFWNVVGNAQYTTAMWLDNYSVLKSNNNVSGSYLYQNLYVMKDNLYYVSLDYLHDMDTNLYAYMGDKIEKSLVLKNNSGRTWTRLSQAYRAVFDGNSEFILGDSGAVSYIGNSYFTNTMILNLTASFGSGYEPDVLWVENNIDWFDGTISYIQVRDIKYGENTVIHFTPYMGYNSYSISCVDEEGRVLSTYRMSALDLPTDGEDESEEGIEPMEGESPIEGEEDTDEGTDEPEPPRVDGRTNRELELEEITSNIKCSVEWGTI